MLCPLTFKRIPVSAHATLHMNEGSGSHSWRIPYFLTGWCFLEFLAATAAIKKSFDIQTRKEITAICTIGLSRCLYQQGFIFPWNKPVQFLSDEATR